ncbi:MAG: thiamine pyrophosphate-dependent enzyme, partial [Myxococcota bacterium]|nr:thiamine pyrophosphate-dependent enzyme [Myxococcota bacterium]
MSALAVDASQGHDLSEEIVRLGVLSEALDALLERLERMGLTVDVKSAGRGRVAMMASGLAMMDGDVLFGTRRDLPSALARGLSPVRALEQALGRQGDPALGRGMPGAIQDRGLGVVLTDGNVASHVMHAAGFGHAARLRGEQRAALALFGSAAQASGEL